MSNNLIEIAEEFLKANNIKVEEVFNKFFYNQNSDNIDSFSSENLKEIEFDYDLEDDYELLIEKLNNIKSNMNKLYLELSKSN